MGQFPQNPPQGPMGQPPPFPGQPMDYQSNRFTAPTNKMALTAMILGIAAIPLSCVAIGLLLGPVALVLGIISLLAINKNPQTMSGRGFAITGIATGGASVLAIPLLIAILVPSLGKARELSNRSVCAANIRGITQSFVVYAESNDQFYPYGGGSVGTGARATVAAYPPLGTNELSVAGSMFLLVSNTGRGTGQVAPKSFICKSDPAAVQPSYASGSYWNSPAAADPNLCYSYSFAYPFSSPTALGAWWRNTTDAACPVLADMNPGGQRAGSSSMYNSLTHQGDGQNVGYADGHAEFGRMPTQGEAGDNIYNLNSTSGTSAGTSGQAYSSEPMFNSPGSYDTYMVPMVANKSDYRRE